MKKSLHFLFLLIVAHFSFAQRQVSNIQGQNGGSFPISVGEYEGKAVFIASGDVVNSQVWVTDGMASGTKMLCDLSEDGEKAVVWPNAQNAKIIAGKLFVEVSDITESYLAVVDLSTANRKYFPLKNFKLIDFKGTPYVLIGSTKNKVLIYEDANGLVDVEYPGRLEHFSYESHNDKAIIFSSNNHTFDGTRYAFDGGGWWPPFKVPENIKVSTSTALPWGEKFLLFDGSKVNLFSENGAIEELWTNNSNLRQVSYKINEDKLYLLFFESYDGGEIGMAVEINLITKAYRTQSFASADLLRLADRREITIHNNTLFFTANTSVSERPSHRLVEVNFSDEARIVELEKETEGTQSYYEYKIIAKDSILYFVQYNPEAEWSIFRKLITFNTKNKQVEKHNIYAHSGFQFKKGDKLFLGLSERDDNFEPYAIEPKAGKINFEKLSDLYDKPRVIINGTPTKKGYLFTKVNSERENKYIYKLNADEKIESVELPLNQAYYKYLTLNQTKAPEWGEGRAEVYIEKDDKVLFSDGFQNLIFLNGKKATKFGNLPNFIEFPEIAKTQNSCVVELSDGPRIFSITEGAWIGDTLQNTEKSISLLESAYFIHLPNEQYLLYEKDWKKEPVSVGSEYWVVDKKLYFLQNEGLFVLDSEHSYAPLKVQSLTDGERYQIKMLGNGLLFAINFSDEKSPGYLIKGNKARALNISFDIRLDHYINVIGNYLDVWNHIYWFSGDLSDLKELSIKGRLEEAVSLNEKEDLIYIATGFDKTIMAYTRNIESGKVEEILNESDLREYEILDTVFFNIKNDGKSTLSIYEDGAFKTKPDLGQAQYVNFEFIKGNTLVYLNEYWNRSIFNLTSGKSYKSITNEYLLSGDKMFLCLYNDSLGLEPVSYDLFTGEIKTYDINKGNRSSMAYNFFKMNGHIYCTASSGEDNYQLWRLTNDEEAELVLATSENNSQLVAYPNPTQDVLSLKLPQNKMAEMIFVYDINGRLMRKKQDAMNAIDLSGLRPGMYLIKAVSDEKVFFKRIIKH